VSLSRSICQTRKTATRLRAAIHAPFCCCVAHVVKEHGEIFLPSQAGWFDSYSSWLLVVVVVEVRMFKLQ